MGEISFIHKKIVSQVVFFTAIPLFFIAFMLIYSPFGSREYLDAGRGLYGFNVTILTCITLVYLVGIRLGFHFIFRKQHLKWEWYILWCLGEIIVISMFQALYMCLIYKGAIPYFTVLGRMMGMCALTLVFPYALIILSLEVRAQKEKTVTEKADELVRFQDSSKRVKLVIAASAILYITAEENYVRICYMEGETQKDYVLRSSMKAIEELVQKHGLLRCHRSYYVNPTHVKVLRKDSEGQIIADLDTFVSTHVPISKRYYDGISSLL